MDHDSGDLAQRSVGQLLRDLADREVTGQLTLGRDDLTASVWLRAGAVHTANAPEARTRLGDRLVGAGELTTRQLEAALELQQQMAEPRRLGEILLEQGQIDRETLRGFVSEQITDSVTATLGWREGWWTLYPGVVTDDDIGLDTSIENLLMEATRRFEEWEVVLGTLGSLDAVIDFAPRGEGSQLALTPDEWSLLLHIDGQTSVADIAEASGYGQVETARIVYGLLTAGVVRVLEPGLSEHPAWVGASPGAAAEDTSSATGRRGAPAPTAAPAEDEAGTDDAASLTPPDRKRLLAEFAGLSEFGDANASDDTGTRGEGHEAAPEMREPRDQERPKGMLDRFRRR